MKICTDFRPIARLKHAVASYRLAVRENAKCGCAACAASKVLSMVRILLQAGVVINVVSACVWALVAALSYSADLPVFMAAAVAGGNAALAVLCNTLGLEADVAWGLVRAATSKRGSKK